MLVLRKEIKIGIGAGLTILGIAAVYGLMASLSSNDHKDQTAITTPAEGVSPKGGLDTAIGGLPPHIDPVVEKPADPNRRDPFAESNRTDGNTQTDPWATALTTGRVNGDLHPVTIVKAPTGIQPERKPDMKGVPVSSGLEAFKPTPAVDRHVNSSAKTNNAAATAAASTSGSKYVIQAGDTFSTISAKVYGTKRFYAALAKANPDVNPSRLRIGHEITVPAKEAVASVGGAIEPDPIKLSAPIDASHQYRIASGDTLSRISAKLYGKSTMWEAIYETNKSSIGPDSGKLKIGTLLDLPQAPNR